MKIETPRRSWSGVWIGAATLLVVWSAVYLPWLGTSGFSLSEGHRAIPGFETLAAWREGRFTLLTTMFEQVYLRKPPGMPWAVAISASLFGESEWSARLVSALSALVMVFSAWWFARRWFGEHSALAAGLVQALTPLWWTVGRSAEIESLNNAATQVAAFVIVDRLLNVGDRPRSVARRATRWIAWAGLLTVALVLMLLAKGPASVPVVAVAAVAAVLARGRPGWRGALHALENWHGSWVVRVPVMLAIAAAGLYLLTLRGQILASGVTPVLQSPGEFLWSGVSGNALGDRLAALGKALGSVLAMGPTALAAALPASIFLLSILRPNPLRDEADARRRRIARALVMTCVGSIVIYMLAGVGNPRYAMPACVVLAPLAAFARRELAERAAEHQSWSDRAVAWVLLARPVLAGCVMMVAAWGFIAISEAQRERSSGRAAGLALGQALSKALGGEATPIDLWANDLIEARPEVLYYAQREARGIIRVRWTPGLGGHNSSPWPPARSLVALRTDQASAESTLAAGGPSHPHLDQLFKGRVAQFEFVVARVRPHAADGAQIQN